MAGFLREIAAVVVPPRCCICEMRCDPGSALCSGCLRALSGQPHAAGPGWWSAAPYEGIAREAVIALKFRSLTGLAGAMAGLMASHAPAGLLEGTLVPVPASPRRRRARGFDPAMLITRELAKLAGRPHATPLARADGRRQAERHRAERIASPPAMRCAGPAPEQAVLVDDVRTTGATLAACATALETGGAARVAAVTFAWTRPFVRSLGAGLREA